jgi:hypothetical protein
MIYLTLLPLILVLALFARTGGKERRDVPHLTSAAVSHPKPRLRDEAHSGFA